MDSMRAIRVTLGFVSSASSIRSMPYKLRLQHRGISRDDDCEHISQRNIAIISTFPPTAPFSKHTLTTPSAYVSVQGEREEKKKSKLVVTKGTLRYKGGTRVKSQTFLSGECARERRLRSRNVDRSKLYTITNPTRNYHVTSLAHCASGNVKD